MRSAPPPACLLRCGTLASLRTACLGGPDVDATPADQGRMSGDNGEILDADLVPPDCHLLSDVRPCCWQAGGPWQRVTLRPAGGPCAEQAATRQGSLGEERRARRGPCSRPTPAQVFAKDILFFGLRVRMCVASGLCEHTKVRSCSPASRPQAAPAARLSAWRACLRAA